MRMGVVGVEENWEGVEMVGVRRKEERSRALGSWLRPLPAEVPPLFSAPLVDHSARPVQRIACIGGEVGGITC